MSSDSGASPLADRLASALADRYRIERELGAGGMATVYLARDLKHDREVAIKVLRPELAAVLGVDRFLNEIKITAALDHPHILTLIDSGAADGALYYVVPYVRGESLRERLKTEGQLPLEDALRITSQVASALDYAHRQGVVHRDIKPENILLQEGVVLLADFGIALALRQAGGRRLTETGLSLGTPQYMSPEQATGDRVLDARSDVYSLAAVLYEMLAGDPPHTGSTVQAVIAKLISDRPTPLRLLRDTVPDGIEDAVTKALAKSPADRFTSAGSFATALAAGAAGRRTVRARTLAKRLAIGAVGIAVVIAVALWAVRSGGARRGVDLRDHTQLTANGRTSVAAISADGKQFVYVTRIRDPQQSPVSLTIQDLDGTAARRLIDSVAFIDEVQMSPDRRQLLLLANINGRDGEYLLSTLGGAPRLIPDVADAAFFASGDSLLLAPPPVHDTVAWIRVAAIDGIVRDSIRVPGGSSEIFARAVPRSPWIALKLAHATSDELRVIDRQGRERDHRAVRITGTLMRASMDALWWIEPDAKRLLRLAIDPRSGRLAAAIDTVLSGRVTSRFDVSADGTALLVGEPTYWADMYALEFRDLLRGETPVATRFEHNVTTGRQAIISPDGTRLLLGPFTQLGFISSDRRLYTIPFGGGAESPLAARGAIMALGWADSVTTTLQERESGRTRLVAVDVRTGARRDELTLPDSGSEPVSFTALPGGGWAWIPSDLQTILVQRRGESAPRAIHKPGWYGSLVMVLSASADGRLAFSGENVAKDSAGVSVVPTDGGDPISWSTAKCCTKTMQWLAGGSLLWVLETDSAAKVFFRLRGPGPMERLGRFAPLEWHAWQVSVSADLKRAEVTRGNSQADFWMWRVSPR